MEVSVKSRPWIKAAISGDTDAITGVRLAFLTHTGSPADADWKTAEYVDGNARILIGPGSPLELPAATYRMWVEINAAPELVREPAGIVRITP